MFDAWDRIGDTAKCRAAMQPMPPADEAPTAMFRCHAYACTMMARSCARQHIDARQSHVPSRDACIDCPAGAARAAALAVGDAKCPVPLDGLQCPNPPRQGSRFCERHRFHISSLPPSNASRPESADEPPGYRKRAIPVAGRRQTDVRMAPRVVSTCGDCGRSHMSERPFCFRCVARAKESLRRRDRSDDWESVLEWLAIPRSERFDRREPVKAACERCGKERRVRRGSRTESLGNWCGTCVSAARSRLRKAGVVDGTPEQYAAELRSMGAPTGRGGARVPMFDRPNRNAHLGIKWDEQPLGEVDPAELALRLGCTRSAVMSAMKVRGIEWKRSVA